MPEHCRGSTFAACISQRVISQWVLKQGWRDGQFQILLQWLHTPIQPNIMEDPLRISHLLKNTFMSWSLQKHIPRNPKPQWPKKPTKSTQTPRYLHLYTVTCLYQQKPVLFQKMNTSFPLVFANKSASGEELGSVNLYFVVGVTDSNRGNMQQMVQKSVNPAI